MNSFSERLRIKNSLAMLEQTFISMSHNGINPSRFVEWYVLQGVEAQSQNLLIEASVDWLQQELLLVEGYFRQYTGNTLGTATPWTIRNTGRAVGGAAGAVADVAQGVGDAAQKTYNDRPWQGFSQGWNAVRNWGANPTASNGAAPNAAGTTGPQTTTGGASNPIFTQAFADASKAMDSLTSRIAKSKGLKDRIGDPQFQSMVIRLKNMLDHPDTVSPSPAAPVATETISRGFTRKLRETNRDNEIRLGLQDLQTHGIDPELFVEWYAEEGQYLNEGWWDNIKNWGKNLWGKVKTRWNNWNDYHNQRRDDGVVQNAMQALAKLAQGVAGRPLSDDFLNTINAIRQKLQQVSAGDTQQTPVATNPAQTPTESPSEPPQPTNGPPVQNPPENNDQLVGKPSWTNQLPVDSSTNPKSPEYVSQAIQLFHQLPDEEKQKIDQLARQVWERKGRPEQDENGMNQDKATAMYAMSMGYGMPTESVRTPFYQYLKRRAQ